MADTTSETPSESTSSDRSPAEGQPQRLYLIDGYSNIFRGFYAIRNLSSSSGEPTNAVFGFLQMLKKLLADHRPELVGVALDVSSDTHRKERYEDYKANRRPMPEELKPQIPRIRQLLEAYRIPILELERYEADDVLGTLARKAAAEGFEVVLVSADKDLMQLVGPQVFLYHTGRDKLYDAALVEEDFGVPPSQVVDVLALMGDASDNVPGVPGIGEKGAKKLIAEHGSLEALLDNAGEVSRKSYREGLQENREQALLSQELVTIHTDLDLAFDPDDLRHDPPDTEALKTLFTELEFWSLVEELDRDVAAEEEIPPAEELVTAEAWAERAGALGQRLGLAWVGTEECIALAVADLAEPAGDGLPDDGETPPVLLADFRRPGLRDAVMASLATWATDPDRTLVGHDLKEVLRLLGERLLGADLDCQCGLEDAMLLSYVLKPGAHSHGFEELVLERTGRKVLTAKDAGWGKGTEPALGDARLLAYAGERATLGARLVARLRAELAEAGGALEAIYREIEEPLTPVLLGMEERGVLLDTEFLAAMSAELETEITELEAKIYEVAGEEFNIGSPQQLGVILFEKLDHPVIKRTKKTKSYSTGAEVLEELANRGFPLPVHLLRYRELTKLKSTYVDALPLLVAEDGRVHTRFNQAVAATGRLSSANPNLQNIPVRTELGQRIRKAFVAREGHLLLVADYSQVELRILAHIAQEPALLEAFQRGDDIHQATAATVLGVMPELVTAEQRRAAKTINFGIIYGMSAYGLASTLGIDRAEAQRFIDTYLDRYAGVRRYMDETLETAERDLAVVTLNGRVRHLPEIKSRNWNLRENARRMAINARIQGTAADLMKLAMIRLDRRLRREHPEVGLLLTVHDELVLEVPEGEIEEIAGLVREEMAGVAKYDVPLVVDTGWGPSWYEAKD